MYKLILSLAVLAITASACKKNISERGFGAGSTNAGLVDIPNIIPTIIDEDLYLGAHVWVLDGKCYVTNGATLTIGEGARIEAVRKENVNDASALIITRGSQLNVLGSYLAPVVFTSQEINPFPGAWGGIVMLGNAPINTGDQLVEGIDPATVPAGVDIGYGGGGAGAGNPHHFGGVLEYVRVEYAGLFVGVDKSMSGLTLAGVGDSTYLNFIEVAHGGSDAFRFFGGKVNAKHLFALAPYDDAFDFTRGYTGNIQYAVSRLNPALLYYANPNGIHSENDINSSGNTPRTRPTISNMTVIGMSAASNGLLNGAHLRRNTSYVIKNSIIMGYPTGVNIQSAGSLADVANITHNLVQAFNTSASPPGNQVFLGGNANDNILLADPFNSVNPDFRPIYGSPPLTLGVDFTGFPADFFDTFVTYRGAFDVMDPFMNTNWLAEWAKFDYY